MTGSLNGGAMKVRDSQPLTPKFLADTMEPSARGDLVFRTIHGPQTLYRFGAIDFRSMQCWFSQQEYLRADRIAKADLSCGGSYNDSLRRVLRDRLAVRLDWNDFSQLHVLHLPDDAVLEAFVSVIREQPLVTPHTHRRQDGPSGRTRSTRMLRGGAGQIWLLPVPRWVEHRPAFLKGG